MDEKVLKFHFVGKGVDVVVDDIDKVMLIDLIVEYLDKAEQQDIQHPKYPDFSYVYEMAHFQLNSDKDLMNMFTNLPNRKEIYIWVGELSEPTALLIDIFSLRATQSSVVPPYVEPPITQYNRSKAQPPKKLTPRRSCRVQSSSPNDECHGSKSSPVVEFASFIDGTFNNIDLDETLHDIVVSKATAHKGRGRGRVQGKGKRPLYPEFGQNDTPDTETSQPEPTTTIVLHTPVLETPAIQPQLKWNALLKKSSYKSFQPKKIPKTTAIRKGIVSSTTQPMLSKGNGKRTRTTTVSLIWDPSDIEELNLDDDEVYSPTSSEMQELSEDIESLDDEGEDGSDADYDFMVNDSFDPYEGPMLDDFGDEEDNYFAKLYKNGEMYTQEEFGKIVLKPWQIFMDKQHLRDVVRDYCIQVGFSVIIIRANNAKYTAICSALSCNWRLHAGRLPDGITWAIKSIQNPEHSCIGLETRNPMVNLKWATRVLLEDIRANNDVHAKALNKLLFQRYGIQMCQSTLYRVRKFALIEIHGGHDVSYSYLPNYCKVIKSLNSRSVAACAWNPLTHPERPLGFTSIFISFKGALDGLFAGCRSLVGVDGAHLSGNYGGVVLSAVALDGNNEIFPFAWAIVAGEDEEAWKFFIWHLKNVLKDSGRGDGWCIMSDRQKGIIKAIAELWPKVDRRYCCKHLSKNFKKKFPGPLMLSLFWKASGAYSPFTFKKAMVQLQKANHLAVVWLAEIGAQSTWSKHAFKPIVKSDVNKNNFVESFNATLGIDRYRLVLTLLEGIRRVTMVRMATRRQMCEEWDREDICPNIIKGLHVLSNESRTSVPYLGGEGEYEVQDGKSTLPVSLNNMTCKCGAWQLSGLPCRHAMRAIHHARLDPHKFVSEWYSVDMYKVTYGASINSIPDKEQWAESSLPVIEPPAFRRGVGRPCRNRRREEDEQKKCKRSKTVKCSICKEFGHNSATSKGGLIAKEKGKTKQSKNKKG